MRNVITTTISLSPVLARRARQLAQREGRTMSELFREAFRTYEAQSDTFGRRQPRSLTFLGKHLRAIRTRGRKADLGQLVIDDRRGH